MRISDWSSDVCSSDLRRPIIVSRIAWGSTNIRTDRRSIARCSPRRGSSRCGLRDAAGGSSSAAGSGSGSTTAFGGDSPDASRGLRAPEGGEAAHLARRLILADHRFERLQRRDQRRCAVRLAEACDGDRSEEHTSELQSLVRISYAVFCLKKKKT